MILPGMIALVLGAGHDATAAGQGLVPAKLAADGAPLLDGTGRVVLDYDLATPMMLGIVLAVAAAYVTGAFNNIMDLLQLVFAF